MARVICYTRVSSEEQTRGASLGDQSERIKAWLEANGHVLVAAYAEFGSGGSTKNRHEFTKMMSEVEALRPDILIVDSSDRFTRNALDGGKWISHITELSVRLAVIEHDEGRVLDMSAYADRSYVTNQFTIADGERERMSQRQKKRYSKATTKVNRPPWGVVLEDGPRSRRRLVSDPERAGIVAEIDRRILGGESINKILDWLRVVAPDSWRERSSIVRMLKDEHNSYVIAGVRSAETQQRLREMFAGRRHIFGRDRKINPSNTIVDPVEALLREVSGEASLNRPRIREHMLAGLVACGKCCDAGRDASASLMAGYYANGNSQPFALSCVGKRGGAQIHARWSVSVSRIVPLLYDKLIKLRDDRVADAVLERWVTEPAKRGGANTEREALERQLAGVDEEEAMLEGEVSAAFRLLSRDKPGLAAEAERQIERAHSNRLALSAKRASLASRLSNLPAPRTRRLGSLDRDELRVNAEALLTGVQIDPYSDSQWIEVDVRDVFAKWVRLLGPPIARRGRDTKHGSVALDWPYIDDVLPEAAPDFT